MNLKTLCYTNLKEFNYFNFNIADNWWLNKKIYFTLFENFIHSFDLIIMVFIIRLFYFLEYSTNIKFTIC